MRIFLILIITFPLVCLSQYNSKIIDMQGLTNTDGVTCLIYKQNEYDFSFGNYYKFISDIWQYNSKNKNNILRWDTNIDTWDSVNLAGLVVFWDNDPDKFIRFGHSYAPLSPEMFFWHYQYGKIFLKPDNPGADNEYKLMLSEINPAKLFLVYNDSTFASQDSGQTWHYFSDKQIIALNPFQEKYIYAVNSSNQLMFSSDTGKIFTIADDKPVWNINSQIEFDKDKTHLYAITEDSLSNYFFISDDLGKPGTWNDERVTEKIYYCLSSWYTFEDICAHINNYLQLTIDDSVSGKLYLSEGGALYKSLDYGNTLSKDTAFVSQISGLYLVPNSDTLYLAMPKMIQKYYNKIIETEIDLTSEVYLQFYPLNDGDLWLYHVENDDYGDNPTPTYSEYILKKEVIGDTLMEDGFVYKIIEETRSDYRRKNYTYLRISGHSIISNKNTIYYNFSKIQGDINYGNWNERSIFFSEENTELWETDVTQRTYFVYSLAAAYEKLILNIGLAFSFEEYDFGYSTCTLTGAFVNGVVYRDTSFAVSLEKPEDNTLSFQLKQNYPNPFNNLTIINYQLAIGNDIKLLVYDALGQEVKILVNKSQPAGSYQITFDTAGLASGIYYYRLVAGDFIQTRKMILLK